VKLIIQPDDGLKPLLKVIRRARRSIDITIFRFDRAELEKALESAVERGVTVRALIAHTNRGGEKVLRKLETRMLAAGITVARTADDLPRYHGKMLMVDDTLYVLGFNYTKLDIDKSRSFGIITKDRGIVREASALFEADRTRQPYSASHNRLVVSPESSRELLSAFIRGAKKQLLIYDEKVSDNVVQRLLLGRAKAGVEIRIIGKLEKPLESIEARKLKDLRLHVRAIVRDGASAFVGSQSLRKLELDGRREVGVIVNNTRIAKRLQSVFEADWAASGEAKTPAPAKDAGTEPKSKEKEATSGA
jgi:phosphatidylserine/phosphatidylglycerophosphate/cardiolipin synthase-like enzyme